MGSGAAAGDGCASRSCTLGHVRPQRHASHQAEVARALLEGTKTLVLPPPTTDARVDLWEAPPALVRRVANPILPAAERVARMRARKAERRAAIKAQ